MFFLVGSTAWSSTGAGELVAPHRIENLSRFLSELVPYPCRTETCTFGTLWVWAESIWRDRGAEALGTTLALSIVSIFFASITAFSLSFLAARGLGRSAVPETALVRLRAGTTRVLFVSLRAVPEYVWAFLFVSLLGPGAAPGVLALGIHNLGVLGRLGGDLVENVPGAPLAALSRIGANRAHVATAAVAPLIVPRFVLLAMYRWETCMREATVLGMLGIFSLGYWIQDGRARNRYDEMLFFIILGAAVIIVGDVTSAIMRRAVRLGYSNSGQ